MFVGGSCGIDLKVKFGKEEKPVESGKFVDYADVQGLDVETEGVEITTVNGHDADYFKDKTISLLRIREHTVNYLPTGLEKFFPHLEELTITGVELKSLKQADLKPFTHLKELFVFSNLLETLDNNIFEFNTELVDVNFGTNKLKHIGADIFAPLKNLKRADFSGNVCVDNFGGEHLTKPDLTDLLNDIKTKCKPTTTA